MPAGRRGLRRRAYYPTNTWVDLAIESSCDLATPAHGRACSGWPDGQITRSSDLHVHPSQTTAPASAKLRFMTSQTLASTLEGFLSGSSGAVVVEDGAVVFNLEYAKYSVSGETSKCLLHLWSEERNI